MDYMETTNHTKVIEKILKGNFKCPNVIHAHVKLLSFS